jgi:CDP-glycerol glycerophosphotransferase (TagB/SpsB family)
LSHPAAPHAVGARQVEVLGGSWTRIQLILRMRALDTDPVDPAEVRLQGPSRPGRRRDVLGGELVPPARVWLEGDVLHVRINVMLGPGRVPFPDGPWSLVLAGHEGGSIRPLVVSAAGQGPVPAGVFSLVRGRYSVTPIVAAGQPLALDIRLGPPDPLPANEASDPSGDDEAGADGRAALDGTATAGATPHRSTVLKPIRQLRPWVFQALFRLLRAVSRRNGRRILFTSDSRAELGGNLKIVHDRMIERGLDREYEFMTLFRESIAMRRRAADRLRLPWLLARADVVVLDDYQPVIYRVDDPDVRIVQLWHAWGAFKTVGYSRVGKPGGLSPWSRVHKNYTYAIVSSDPEVEFYAEAFGLPEDRVRPTGIPRMDGFWDPARAARSRELALEAYPAARDRFVILFAPTFRGHGAKTATYPVELLDWAALHALCVEKDAACIIRLHPFVRQPLDIPAAFADRIIDGATSTIDINDVLFAADLLVTDYSSVVFEFSTRDKPMLFFAYDLEEYVATRDFYVEYESFVPGRIVRSFPDLLDAIRRDDYQPERLAAFRAAHLDHFDGRATDRVIDLIIGR